MPQTTEIDAIFRKHLIKFAAHTAVAGVAGAALLTALVQFLRDYHDMGLAAAWDLFTHLPPWEWVGPGTWVSVIVAGGVICSTVTTTAFYFAEHPRWNR